MLRSIKAMRDYVLAAKDGHIGRCRDFLFDDSAWTVRYMVADTGSWLPKRKVLISPTSLGEPDWESRLFHVTLTKEEIENSPDLASDAPVSLEYERKWHDHYHWSPYWYGGDLWDPGHVPRALDQQKPAEVATEEAPESASHNLRSVQEVVDYHVQTTDGAIGHVEDFIVDDATWTIHYIVVDTRNWLPGKRVLVTPEWITKIEWRNRDLYVDLTRSLVKNGPAYDPATLVNRRYETRLYDYYGRPKYWE